RRLAYHQAAVVDARLHPADVVAHDEEDVGLLLLLLLLLRGRRQACHRHGREQCEQTEADFPRHAHGFSSTLCAARIGPAAGARRKSCSTLAPTSRAIRGRVKGFTRKNGHALLDRGPTSRGCRSSSGAPMIGTLG